MSPSRTERWRKWSRWLPFAALAALVPKCFVCVAAYVGMGAWLGIKVGAPELCGGRAEFPLSSIFLLAMTAGGGVFIALRRSSIRDRPEGRR